MRNGALLPRVRRIFMPTEKIWEVKQVKLELSVLPLSVLRMGIQKFGTKIFRRKLRIVQGSATPDLAVQQQTEEEEFY